jgi:dTDP-6-deoxy-L-talose 4-dehydrogenase (NAD+)
MKKILVTGATGFIGQYVINELLTYDVEIIATSSDINKAKQFSWFKMVNYIPLNFENLNPDVNYFEYFNQPDIVLHLAWEGLPNYKSDFHTKINLPRHLSFVKNLISNGLKDLNVVGTCFEYGMQEGCLSEAMPVFPDNHYAIAKNELRLELENIQNKFKFDFKWIRLFYMYGKGQNPKSILSQLELALEKNEEVFNMSGGEQTRDYLPIEKVAAYIVKTTLQNQINGIVNCCSGNPITIKDLVNNFILQKNKKIKLNFGYYPYPDYEPMHFWGDNTKINLIIGNK